MKILSFIPDYRIEATNVLIELTIGEYLTFAEYILENNDYQRKKVIQSKLQETLKADLLRGCTIPPIVLAVKKTEVNNEFDFVKFKDIDFITNIIDKKEILILDGLQRTFVMLELNKEYKSKRLQEKDVEKFLSQIIRAELYIGLKKLGILYRMLTLNTGQTTMSTRHLMEILYLDYIGSDLEGITLIPDKDNSKVKENTSEYKFKEVLDGYLAFIEGKEVPIERADILDNIQTLKELERTDEEKEGFKNFVRIFKLLLDKFIEVSDDFKFNEEDHDTSELRLSGPPYGKDALSLFKKSQTLTGFGAALNFVCNRRGQTFENIEKEIANINLRNNSGKEIFRLVNKHFDYIRNRSKKVGNDQRYYFRVFFQTLFDGESHDYLIFDNCIEYAYQRVKERIEHES